MNDKKEATVRIETDFAKVEMPMIELTVRERSTLANILGLQGARKEAFELIRHLPTFKKIQPKEVWATCPKRMRGFHTNVKTTHFFGKVASGLNPTFAKIEDLMPAADLTLTQHTVSGFCKRCGAMHAVSRNSVLVKTVVKGIPFSMMVAAD